MEENLKSLPSAGYLRMRSSRLLAVFCLLWGTFSAVSGEEPAQVNMLIDVVAWGNDIHGLHLGAPGSPSEAIHARSFRYGGEPVRYSGPRLLAVYQSTNEAQGQDALVESVENPKAAGAVNGRIPRTLAERRVEEPNLVALVELPLNAGRATLLLSPAAGGTYQVYTINDDPSQLPVGQLLVHNLSPHEVAMQLGASQPVLIQPRGQFLFSSADKYLPYRLAYRLNYRTEQTQDWKMQGSNIIRLSPEEQTQMIILRSDNQYFLSSSGARCGYLQMVILRRKPE